MMRNFLSWLQAFASSLGVRSLIAHYFGLDDHVGSRDDATFRESRQLYVAYCRYVQTKRISNGKKKGASNSKNGNKYLAWEFVEAAHFAVRYNPRIKRYYHYYQRKKAQRNTSVATKAVAHKLAQACYFVHWAT